MNINTLEQATRQALKGENMGEKSSGLFSSGLISPTEHRSLQSLSFQIAANLQVEKGTGTAAFIRPIPTLTWV
jgi:hypothetical protein